VPHVNVRAQHRATHPPRIGKQVQIGSAQSKSFPDPQAPIPQQRHHESFPRPATTRRDPFDLLGSERLGKRRLRPRLECAGPHHPELAGFPHIKTRRDKPQPAGFRQPVGDGCSITPVLAQNRKNSHTAVRIAFTVAPERNRPSRRGVASTKCLKRANLGRSMDDHSTP
jgi:hypothetical protein